VSSLKRAGIGFACSFNIALFTSTKDVWGCVSKKSCICLLASSNFGIKERLLGLGFMEIKTIGTLGNFFLIRKNSC
jgi:hypothetical protein